MKISIIIPAYNCSDHLPRMINSIYESGLSDFEIIIINDGSTDDTGVVAKKAASLRRELRVINQKNQGVSAARNRGIREARGEFIFFVDADDLLVADSLTGINQILETEYMDMLLFGVCFDYFKNGCVYRSDELTYPKKGLMSKPEWTEALEELFACNMLSPVWNKLIRRDLVVSNNIWFREDMIEMEDYLFSIQCLAHCDQIFIMDKAAYRYQQDEDERGTFNRLWRLNSLSQYVSPFYEAASEFAFRCGIPEKVLCIADQIYSMLFHEQLRFATQDQIQMAAEDMLSGEHANVIAQSDPDLYHKLKHKQYTSVWCQRAMSRVRHQVAVQVKYIRRLRNTQ